MFSKRARYALHGVGFLAYLYPRAPVPLAEILRYLEDYSGEPTLSSGYIAKVFQDLARSGVVRTVPGRKGGYALARSPHELRLLDIVTALDGPQQDQCCLLSVGGCGREALCGVHEVISRAERAYYDYLASENATGLAAKMFRREGPLGAPAWSRRDRKRASPPTS